MAIILNADGRMYGPGQYGFANYALESNTRLATYDGTSVDCRTIRSQSDPKILAIVPESPSHDIDTSLW